jgi:hypothetical protein
MGVGGQRQASAASPPGKRPDIIIQQDGWDSWSVWKGAESLAPKRIRSPDRPESLHRHRPESLYRLRKIIHEHVSI